MELLEEVDGVVVIVTNANGAGLFLFLSLEKIKTRVPVHLPNYSESSVGAERV
jgi:hypothetical protein